MRIAKLTVAPQRTRSSVKGIAVRYSSLVRSVLWSEGRVFSYVDRELKLGVIELNPQ